ncbi:GntR family transcriptional regulator [Virgibacillus sp. JSM 102003]|uniref:GntR family transcriptional regulator n=1 Tax=Virgibacillus sp. JSM 102003 TaxID=1562108 RepID=UPI0035BF49C2
MQQDILKKTTLYNQLKEMIMKDIRSGKLKHGDKIMSERRIADKCNVSRMTARKALLVLEREGLVEKRKGVGTFITRKIEMDFITFNSYSKELIKKGMQPSTKLLEIYKENPDEHIRENLKIDEDTDVIVLKRLRLGDGIPIAIEMSFIPYYLCAGIEEYIADDVSLYGTLEQSYNIKPVKADQYIQILQASEEECRLLTIPGDSVCIFIDSTAFSGEEEPVEFTRSVTRSDIIRYYSRLYLNPSE